MRSSVDLRRVFSKSFAKAIAPLGFFPTEQMLYERQRGELRDIVAAGPRSAPRGLALGLGSVGLVLPAVEQLRSRLNLTERNATVAIGLHLLLPDKQFREWSVSTVADIDEVVPYMLDTLKDAGLPFLESFKTVADLKRKLGEPDPALWFMCSQDARGVILVLLEAIDSGLQAAIGLCERLLAELAERPPKYSHELRTLLGALNASGASLG